MLCLTCLLTRSDLDTWHFLKLNSASCNIGTGNRIIRDNNQLQLQQNEVLYARVLFQPRLHLTYKTSPVFSPRSPRSPFSPLYPRSPLKPFRGKGNITRQSYFNEQHPPHLSKQNPLHKLLAMIRTEVTLFPTTKFGCNIFLVAVFFFLASSRLRAVSNQGKYECHSKKMPNTAQN